LARNDERSGAPSKPRPSTLRGIQLTAGAKPVWLPAHMSAWKVPELTRTAHIKLNQQA